MNFIYKRMLLHLAVYALLFFVLPLLLRNRTGTMEDLGALVMLLLIVNPAVVLLLSGELGFRTGFRPLLSLLLASVMFALSVLTVFEGNGTGVAYAAVYGLIALAGTAAGALIRGKIPR